MAENADGEHRYPDGEPEQDHHAGDGPAQPDRYARRARARLFTHDCRARTSSPPGDGNAKQKKQGRGDRREHDHAIVAMARGRHCRTGAGVRRRTDCEAVRCGEPTHRRLCGSEDPGWAGCDPTFR